MDEINHLYFNNLLTDHVAKFELVVIFVSMGS